jgi:hypothetical protein
VGLAEEIMDGFHDHELRAISEALRDRKETLGRRKHRSFNVGDTVTFVNLGMGAKYMNGETAVIEELNPKTVWVRLTPDSKARLAGTRFGRSWRIKVYPNNIELSFLEGRARQPDPKLNAGPINVTPSDEVSE